MASLTAVGQLALALLFTAIAVRASLAANLANPTASAPCGASQSARPTTTAVAFLCARCATTLYPAVCFDSLLPYAATFQTSSVRLARAATDVAAARLRAFSARLKDLVHRDAGTDDVPGPLQVASALRDCASTISSAAGLARRSAAELGRLDAATAGSSSEMSTADRREARWEVSNAQTWLSAAMTNQGTCADGFADAGKAAAASATGKEVAAGVASVSQDTSNALALVNGIPL